MPTLYLLKYYLICIADKLNMIHKRRTNECDLHKIIKFYPVWSQTHDFGFNYIKTYGIA